jgi:RHS repeat-associated protein
MTTVGIVLFDYKFTGKERDAESGLDEFGARFHASALGRFMTPDWDAKPVTVPYAKFGDPQTLNLYSYVENDPVNRADADGHQENRTGACPGSPGCPITKKSEDQTGPGAKKGQHNIFLNE